MASSESTTGMFEILDATEDNLIAVRVGNGSPAGYKEFYSLLIERTNQYGSVVVYEEVPDWTVGTYLTHLHGIMPDIQYGPDFDISHYACVGDSRWTKLLYHQWRAIKPVWPVAPDTMRYYHLTNRDNALRWVTDVAGHT